MAEPTDEEIQQHAARKKAAGQFGALLDAITAEDDLGATIRCQVHVEHYLEKIISQVVPFPERLDFERMQFHQRLELVLALDAIPERMAPSLRKLAWLRNQFGHKIDAVVTEKIVHEIYTSLDANERKMTNDLLKSEPADKNPLKHLPIHRRKLRFMIVAIVTFMAAAVAVRSQDFKEAVRQLGLPVTQAEAEQLAEGWRQPEP